MAPLPASSTTQALLEHRDFVRDLARSLLCDRELAEDVAQDTLLGLLRNPPQAVRSLRALLATATRRRALNTMRETKRRGAREEAAAVPEATAGDDDLAGCLARQQRVVQAVLALDAPYREVVLLRHYEGLGVRAIAARIGVPEATVRSRLARGHERLRRRLESEFGGRDALKGALGSLLAPAGAKSAALAVAAAATLLLAATAVCSRLLAPAVAPNGPTRAARAAPAVPAQGPPLARGELAPAVVASALQVLPREEAALDAPPAEVPTTPAELAVLIRQAQALARARLLQVPERLRAEHEPALVALGGGLTRLLERSRLGDAETMLLGDQESGNYYSFAMGSHCYQDEPDIGLQQGDFESGFSGNDAGYFLALGDVPLESVAASGWQAPATLTFQQRACFEHLLSEASVTARGRNPRFDEEAERLGAAREVAARAGETWLLRSLHNGEHDFAVAFRALEQDEYGWTIAWRPLASRPVERQTGDDGRCPFHADRPPLPPVPEWLAAQGLPELEATIRRLRGDWTQRMLDLSPERQRELAATFGPEARFARLTNRDGAGELALVRSGGSYFSFATESHSFNEAPDLALFGQPDAGMLMPHDGAIVDLGAVDLAAAAELAPEGLAAAPDRVAALRELEEGEPARSRGVEPEVGHTYWLRSRIAGSHDHMVAFSVVDRDADGVTLAYRIRAEYPKPGR